MHRILAALSTGAAILAVTAGSAHADPAESATPLVNPETGGRYAEYNGEYIDLSQGWQGAQICVEQADASIVCYDDEADYRAGEGLAADGPETLALSDCPSAHLCLWDDRQYAGPKIEFRQAGYKDLRDYGFAERANSYFNNRQTVSGLFDHHNSNGTFTLEAGPRGGTRDRHAELSLLREFRGGDGSWNNKIDELLLTS
ncbi:peptidase inhibitor family I36 protein [Jiangella asiatica]|nr:peptidase inhibitor family I36 protein [Jiangella asiatica]